MDLDVVSWKDAHFPVEFSLQPVVVDSPQQQNGHSSAEAQLVSRLAFETVQCACARHKLVCSHAAAIQLATGVRRSDLLLHAKAKVSLGQQQYYLALVQIWNAGDDHAPGVVLSYM